MKKAASTVFAALLLVFSLTFTSEAYESVNYDEISFIIDDNCTLMLDDATGTAWLSEDEKTLPDGYVFENLPVYRPISRLSDSMAESMRMMSEIQKLKKELPCIDCGSCGAPNCRAFAEDVVKKLANIDDCLIRKQRIAEGGENDDR